MGRPSKRDQILEAALARFSEVGFDGTKIRDIAQRAGVSEGALYKHFASKEALARALYSDGIRWISEALAEVVDGPGTPTERARAATLGAFELYRSRPTAFRFVLAWAPEFCSDPGVEPPLLILARLVADGQRTGEFVEGDTGILACLLMGCIAEPMMMGPQAKGMMLDLLEDSSADSLIADFVVAGLLGRPADTSRAHRVP